MIALDHPRPRKERMTRGEILREYFRLCDLVNKVEVETDLLDTDEAQEMRDRYRERADAVLNYLKRETSVGVSRAA